MTLVTAATAEPVTTGEAKQHLRVTIPDDDSYIGNLITAARQRCEAWTRRQFVTATWRETFDAFPRSGERLLLRLPPLQSITSVKYIEDTATGTQQTWSSSEYQVVSASEPAYIVPAYGYSWPTPRAQPAAVEVTMVCGYGAASAVPLPIRQAIMILTAQWYEHREAIVTGSIQAELSFSARMLLEPYMLPEVR